MMMRRFSLLLVVLLVGCDGGESTTTLAPSTTTTVASTTTTTLPLVPPEMVEGGFEVFVINRYYGDPIPVVRDRDVISVDWDYQIYTLSYEDVVDRIAPLVGGWQDAVVLFDGEVLFEFLLYDISKLESGTPTGITGPFGLSSYSRGFRFALCDGYCEDIWGWDEGRTITPAIDYSFMDLLGGVRDHFESTDRLVDSRAVRGWAYRVVGDRILVSVGCRVEADEIRLLSFEDGFPDLWEYPAEAVRWHLVAEDGPVGLSVVELGVVPDGFVEVSPYVAPEEWVTLESSWDWASVVFYRNGAETGFGFVRVAPHWDEEGQWITELGVPDGWDDYQDWLATYPGLIGGNCSVREPDPLG